MTILPVPVYIVLIAFALACAFGCAPARYLTDEQDAEMREMCESVGCTVIPNPIWAQIESILKRSGAI